MGGSLPAPPSTCMKLCFTSLRALKEDRMGMRDYKSPGRRSTWLSRHPQSYTHTLLAWYQCQEKLRLWQPNLKQTPEGNNWILPGWEAGLPAPPSLQNPLQKSHTTLSYSTKCLSALISKSSPLLVPPTLLSSEAAAVNPPLFVTLLHTAAAKKQFFLCKGIDSP